MFKLSLIRNELSLPATIRTQSKSACYLSKASSFISPNLSFKPTPASSAEASKDSNGTSLPKLQSNYTTLPIPPLKPAAYHHHLKRYRH